MSFLPSSLSFSVLFQEGGFLDFYVFSWQRVSFNSEKNSTIKEVQRWPGQRGEQGGGCGAGLPPGHLSHLSQHHPRCTRFKCSCPLPCQPLALNSSLREILPSEQQRNRKQAGSGLPGNREGVTLMDMRCLKGDENVERESCSHRHNLNRLNATSSLNQEDVLVCGFHLSEGAC